MNDIIRAVIMYAVVIALIVGVFKLYKNSTSVDIDPTDRSMNSALYPYGSYKVYTASTRAEQFRPFCGVAFVTTDRQQKTLVAHLMALPGQRIEAIDGKIKVDGKEAPFTVDNKAFSFPEIRVPRGCVYVLHDSPAAGRDSSQLGPLPFTQIVGNLD